MNKASGMTYAPKGASAQVVAPGQLMTYSIEVYTTALATDEPPSPWLTDSVPASTTMVHISDGGVSRTIAGTTIVSWTLPAFATGEYGIWRSYSDGSWRNSGVNRGSYTA